MMVDGDEQTVQQRTTIVVPRISASASEEFSRGQKRVATAVDVHYQVPTSTCPDYTHTITLGRSSRPSGMFVWTEFFHRLIRVHSSSLSHVTTATFAAYKG